VQELDGRGRGVRARGVAVTAGPGDCQTEAWTHPGAARKHRVPQRLGKTGGATRPLGGDDCRVQRLLDTLRRIHGLAPCGIGLPIVFLG